MSSGDDGESERLRKKIELGTLSFVRPTRAGA